jgi:hypothetical protein
VSGTARDSASASNTRQSLSATLSSNVLPQIVDGFLQILPRSQIALGRLHGRVAQQELDLLDA